MDGDRRGAPESAGRARTAPDRVTLARRLLAELGVTPAALAADPREPRIPTLAEYVPRAWAAATSGTRAGYGPCWQRAVDQYGWRRLDEIQPSDILALHRQSWRPPGRGARVEAADTPASISSGPCAISTDLPSATS
jgi:hypothetical protein